MRYFAIFALLCMLSAPAQADGHMQIINSNHSVKVTLDRLTKILKSKGITVMARVNHAAGAKAAGLKLADTELLIFGNPKLGTPLMQSNRMIGLDLPMKVLAWKDESGSVKLAYVAPAELGRRHAIKDRAPVFAKMTKALAALTAAAAK